MITLTKINILFSRFVWEKLSDNSQKKLCQFLGYIYQLPVTRYFIPFFCRRYKINQDLLKRYQPASGASQFLSFQDFFTRKLSSPLQIHSTLVWPVEGRICEAGKIDSIKTITVKGQTLPIKDIFGELKNKLEPTDSFANIFLHNHNYHRFHAPTNAIIKSILPIKGQLLFLRPWFYKRPQVSYPSFLNERVVLELFDDNQKTWLISFVAGMGVGNIKLFDHIRPGYKLHCGEEMGLFLLGSTCCLSIPYTIRPTKYMESINVGSPILNNLY